MSKTFLALAAAGTLLAGPALAGDRNRAPVYSDSNSHYLDYKTDISEAKRELRKDLARADDPADREDAWAEYQREVADAKHDFRKEMAEEGRPIRRIPVVTVE
ncbi:hypothetical protein LK533_14620 [Sphingomonas sp. PL-96]|uniref:hypothetical protein n=1 Tax=Sphingomonas sp. PL-96 TaxID=2887201 RepID=UPI001E478D3E|nr:hypothetical protein [Sphingomonas sp. PL-96]MCC2977906.1 hypothetical protein [Sphingomonas sp. PL-96]